MVRSKSNASFVSLNALALLCGNNKLRFSAEMVIERESIDLRMGEAGTAEAINYSFDTYKCHPVLIYQITYYM